MPRNTNVIDTAWIEKIWAWADEFELDENEIPRDRETLLAIREICIVYRRITYLPPEIGQLSQLQELYLWDNNLNELPLEIGKLSQLQRLYLGGNNLSELPPARVDTISQNQCQRSFYVIWHWYLF